MDIEEKLIKYFDINNPERLNRFGIIIGNTKVANIVDFDYKKFEKATFTSKIYILLNNFNNHKEFLNSELSKFLTDKKEIKKIERFFDREEEKHQILEYPFSKNFIIEAPSKYGKSRLLKEIAEITGNNIEINTFEIMDFKKIYKAEKKTNCKNNSQNCFLPYLNQYWANINIIEKTIKKNKKNFFIIDNFEFHSLLKPKLQVGFSAIINNILSFNSSKIYIIIAGQKVVFNNINFTKNLIHIRLSEFDKNTVEMILRYNVKQSENENIKEIITDKTYTNLWKISNGNPKITIDIVSELVKNDFLKEDILAINSFKNFKYVKEQYDLISKEEDDNNLNEEEKRNNEIIIGYRNRYIETEVEDIISDTNMKSFLSKLSVFRIFNKQTIENISLLKKFNISINEVVDTNLYENRFGDFYGDSIARNLLLSYLEFDEPDDFNELNKHAIELYKEWIDTEIKNSKEMLSFKLEFFIKEFIYHNAIISKNMLIGDIQAELIEINEKIKQNSSFDILSKIGNSIHKDKELFALLEEVIPNKLYKLFK